VTPSPRIRPWDVRANFPRGKPAGCPQPHPPCLVRREPGVDPGMVPNQQADSVTTPGSASHHPASRVPLRELSPNPWYPGLAWRGSREGRTGEPVRLYSTPEVRSECPANWTSDRSPRPPPDTPKCPGARRPLVPRPSHRIAGAISPLRTQSSETPRRSASLI
jgi:hypothetical protein